METDRLDLVAERDRLKDELTKQAPIMASRLARIRELESHISIAMDALVEIGSSFGCIETFSGAQAYKIANEALKSIDTLTHKALDHIANEAIKELSEERDHLRAHLKAGEY